MAYRAEHKITLETLNQLEEEGYEVVHVHDTHLERGNPHSETTYDVLLRKTTPAVINK